MSAELRRRFALPVVPMGSGVAVGTTRLYARLGSKMEMWLDHGSPLGPGLGSPFRKRSACMATRAILAACTYVQQGMTPTEEVRADWNLRERG